MKTLQKYYSTIDSKNFNGLTKESVIELLPNLSPEEEDFKNAKLEYAGFHINKSLNTQEDLENKTVRGLSWISHQKYIDKQSEEISFCFPDVTALTQEDYEYFEQRFLKCSGVFPKTEYGLLVYFGQKTAYSKHNTFKNELADKLRDLANIYWGKISLGNKEYYYLNKYFNILNIALYIYKEIKSTSNINTLCQEIIQHHADWNITRKDTARGISDFTTLMINYFPIFKTKVNYEKVITKNLIAIQEIEKTSPFEAIAIVDKCIAIRQKLNISSKDLLENKAKLFEKIVSKCTNSINCLEYIKEALYAYKTLGNTSKIKELEAAYMKTRSKIKMTNVEYLTNENIKQATSKIQDLVREANNITIIRNLATNHWFSSIDTLKQMTNSIEQQNVLNTIIPTKILDKNGNTIDIYTSQEEIKEMNFWDCFEYSFNLGIELIYTYIIEAYKARKFTYENLLSYLESTWYNDPINHTYYEKNFELRVLDVLKPGLKKCFEELDYAYQNIDNNCNDYVIVVDTLTLKIETILRFMCEKLNISTFKIRKKAGKELTMEKLLDDMLCDLEKTHQKQTGIKMEDILTLKYSLTPKGLNLRNKVAHGLMDLWEYSFREIVILLYLIIKLSSYTFIEEAS